MLETEMYIICSLWFCGLYLIPTCFFYLNVHITKFTSPLLKIMCHKDFVDVFLVKTLLKLLIGNLTYANNIILSLCADISLASKEAREIGAICVQVT